MVAVEVSVISIEYRSEIDGLRAVAVIPVILFHAGFVTFGGGFVGVDVFFVISGYLITSIIVSEKERGDFSLVNFYERRIRRILPALFFVMLVSLFFAWLWLLPSDMVSFSQSLAAVSTFSSNMFFWRTSGYWGLENELIPLLHTWSLAVEEQYYLLFPIFLIVMWRFGTRWVFGSFVVVAIGSLLLAQWGAYNRPTANFFLLLTRGWELAIGAVIAFYFLYRKPGRQTGACHKAVAEALSLAGILMIGYAVFVFDEITPFPGFYALVPTVGTGLIILFATPSTVVGRLLSVKVLVGIGLISYSAYLWHQPLFAFARYRSITSPDAAMLLTLAALSIVLAYLSWRYVEKPFRTKGIYSRKAIFNFAAVGSLLFASIGMAGHISDGWPSRVDEKIQSVVETARLHQKIDQLCLSNTNLDGAGDEACVLVAGNGTYAYMMGDSHAAAIGSEMKTAFEKTEIGLIQATERGCPPVQDVFVYITDKFRCYQHNEDVYRYLEHAANIEYVILVARWAFYAEAERFNNGEGGVEPLQTLYFDIPANEKPNYEPGQLRPVSFGDAYVDSVTKLIEMGKTVILVYPIPEAGWHVPRYVRNYYLRDPDAAFYLSTGSTSYSVFQDRNRSSHIALDSVGDHPNLYRIYPEEIFCDADLAGRCIVQKNASLLYRDDDHLSNAGARLVVSEILSRLDQD